MKRTEDRGLASGWINRENVKMIIGKERSKTFHKYLKLIHDILAAEASGCALYIHEERLYFTIYAMGGELSINNSGVEVYNGLYKEPGAYEIRMTPRKDFEISKLPESKVTGDMKNIFKHATIGLEKKNHLYEISSDCSSVIANIARKSKLRIKDRHLRVMRKLQDFDVSINRGFIICAKAEALDKEDLQVTLIMYLWCKDIQDEYDQDKLGVDQKVEQVLIRVIKEPRDSPKRKRPMQGKVYETLDQISGRYNAQESCRKIIIVSDHKVSVHREEYEPIQKMRKRKSNEEG